MKQPLILLLGLGACLSAFAASDEEIRAAREELRAARTELEKATRELQQLLGDEASPFIGRRLVQREPRPMIGVVMGPRHTEAGVRLSAVTPGGPADRAGLKAGDTILSINGTRLQGRDAVSNAYALLDGMSEGDRFELLIRGEDGSEREIAVEAALHRPSLVVDLSETGAAIAPVAPMAMRLEDLRVDLDRLGDGLPHIRGFRSGPGTDVQVWNLGWQWSGLEMARLNPQLGRYFGTESGVLVLNMEGIDEALIPGDVIIAINGNPVDSPRDVMRELRGTRAGDPVQMDVVRDGRSLPLELTTPESSPHDVFFHYEYGFDEPAPRADAPRPD